MFRNHMPRNITNLSCIKRFNAARYAAPRNAETAKHGAKHDNGVISI